MFLTHVTLMHIVRNELYAYGHRCAFEILKVLANSAHLEKIPSLFYNNTMI